MTTRWTLDVRGRLRTKIELRGDEGEVLTTLRPNGSIGPRNPGLATDPDGREWRVDVDPLYAVASLGDRAYATLDEDSVTVGGRTLRATVARDGARTAKVFGPGGRAVLTVAPGPKDDPWAVFELDRGDLPQPRAVVLTIAFVLLQVEARIIRSGGATGFLGGPGPG
jgi:hypothetical protein